ncbi:prohead core protein [Helicobacter pylori]|nr:prohead core protein [Helicobacter pylori]OOQ27508.1 prohead core protein [Helicobacter pylori]
MIQPLETLDKDKQAMSEAIKKDIKKDKENLARVEADKKVKADEGEKGYEKDDDKKAEKLDKEIAKDKCSPNDDKLYEEDDRVKRDKERDDALRDKEKAKDDACMVRADEDTIEDDEEYGDDDTMSMKNKNNDEVNVIQEYKKIYDECEVTDKIKILGNIQKYQMDMLKFRP